FFATKTLTTGEGGMVVTNDDALAERMRLMSWHGIRRSGPDEWAQRSPWYYEVDHYGFKYNMNSMAAALGRSQLHKTVERRESRKRIATMYDEQLPDSMERPFRHDSDADAWHLYIARLSTRSTRTRDEFCRDMRDAGIGVRVHFIPLHTHPAYRHDE